MTDIVRTSYPSAASEDIGVLASELSSCEIVFMQNDVHGRLFSSRIVFMQDCFHARLLSCRISWDICNAVYGVTARIDGGIVAEIDTEFKR